MKKVIIPAAIVTVLGGATAIIAAIVHKRNAI